MRLGLKAILATSLPLPSLPLPSLPLPSLPLPSPTVFLQKPPEEVSVMLWPVAAQLSAVTSSHRNCLAQLL